MRWRAPRKVFVNSMSDLFQDGVPDEFIRRVWDVMTHAPQHTFQILTKRPQNMLRVVNENALLVRPNIWLGTSVESARYKGRIEWLRQVSAAVRFVSLEPLLGPLGDLDLEGIHWAIIGGESGPRARPMKKEWVEDIRRQCREQRVAFFFKQWGGANKKKAGRKLAGRTWDEYPARPRIAG